MRDASDPCLLDAIGWARRLTGADPIDGLDAVRAFKRFLPSWEEHHVRRARAARTWWMFIAHELGVSEQAAHKRWAARILSQEPAPLLQQLCSKRLCGIEGHPWRYPRARRSRDAGPANPRKT